MVWSGLGNLTPDFSRWFGVVWGSLTCVLIGLGIFRDGWGCLGFNPWLLKRVNGLYHPWMRKTNVGLVGITMATEQSHQVHPGYHLLT